MKVFYQNPVIAGADPFVLLHEGTYYLYSTNCPDGYHVYTSDDLVNWPDRGYCLRAGDGIKGNRGFWAPEVMERGGKFYMVYIAEEHLGIAVSDSPLGPFRQVRNEWLNELNEIDGHFFEDDDGTVWLYFVRFDRGNVLWCARMNDDLLSYDRSTARFLLRAEEEWECRAGSVMEGAFVLKHNGKYYLTYSANDTRSPDYAIGCAVSDKPDGPFVRTSNSPILHRTENVSGTGHHSFTKSKDGGRLICVYHTHESTDRMGTRMTCIDPAGFEKAEDGGDDLLVIHGPSFGKTELEI